MTDHAPKPDAVQSAESSSTPADPLAKAMAEALDAVEARAQGHAPKVQQRVDFDGGDEGIAMEMDATDDEGTRPATDAASAVTEALIGARKELETVLEQTRKEAGDLRDKWLRSAADFENYKKRMQREREDTVKFGNERLLRDFLPVLDDLDRAIQVAQDSQDSTPARILEGVLLVQKKFLAQLERHEVVAFDSKGQAFDPNRHEAVQQVPSELPPGTVADELQRGFMLNERLLRPALVTVSLGLPGGASTDESNNPADAESTRVAPGGHAAEPKAGDASTAARDSDG